MSFPGDIGVEFFRAAKPYKCSCCRNSIHKGQTYARERTYLNHIQVWPHIRAHDEAIICLQCSTIAWLCAHPQLPWYVWKKNPDWLDEKIHNNHAKKKFVYFPKHRMDKIWKRSLERLRFS